MKDKQKTGINKEEITELDAKYKRALADYQNLVKQTARDKSDFARYANENLLHEILPIYEYLKLSLAHAPDDDKWLEGVKYVLKEFARVLEINGVTEIVTENQEFNHETMEAIEEEITDQENLDNKIAKTLKAGYKLYDKVIIPARVVVYKFKN